MQLPRGPIEYSFHIIIGVENVRPFLNLEYALSSGGRLRMQLPKGPIDTLSILLGERRVLDTFNLLAEIRQFEILKMFYPSEGVCERRTQWVLFDTLPFNCG